MKNYELTYLISPELSPEETQGVFAKIEPFLKENEGILIENKVQKKLNLGYLIKKFNQAHLAVLRFQMDPEKIKTFKKSLKDVPEILRFLILAIEPVSQRKETKRKETERKETLETEAPKRIAKEKKVELTEIEKKLEEILGE